MVPENDFLRHIPRVLNSVERMRFEGLVFASDNIAEARARLQSTILARELDAENFTLLERTVLLSASWVIVDQMNIARQLLRAAYKEKDNPHLVEFLALTEPARLLRNKMDHLSGTMPNQAKAKGPRGPIFGALSYFFVPAEFERQHDGKNTFKWGRGFCIWGGDADDTDAQMVNPLDRDLTFPVSCLQLAAFDHAFEIDPAINYLGLMLPYISKWAEGALRVEASRISLETGQALAGLMEPRSGGRIGYIDLGPRPIA